MKSEFENATTVDNKELQQEETTTKVSAKKTKASAKKNVYQKLFSVQQNLKAKKGQYNNFGKYSYRSAEDILEAVKPYLAKENAIILLGDEIVNIDNQMMRGTTKEGAMKEMPYNYVKANATFIDIETGDKIVTSAFARECEHTGMSADQCTGCASSYARKYSLNALLCIDNTSDSDSNEVAEKESKKTSSNKSSWNNWENWGK